MTTLAERAVLVAEERHARSRLALYRAKAYAGRPTTELRRLELEREWQGAARRLSEAASS